MNDVLARAMRGETVEIGRVAAGTTITKELVSAMVDSTNRGEPFGLWLDIPDVRSLAQSFLDKTDEEWTYIDPEDIKRLARAVLAK